MQLCRPLGWTTERLKVNRYATLIKIQYTWSTMFSLMKYTAIILKKYTSSILSVYLEYASIHVGKLHGVYFKYYIFRTIKYTLSILPFFVLISILEVYFSAYCLSLFSSVYLKYTSVHPAFLCSHQYTWSILQCILPFFVLISILEVYFSACKC